MERNSSNLSYNSCGTNSLKILKVALIELSNQNKEGLKQNTDYAGLNFCYIDHLTNEKQRQQASFLTGKLNGSWKFTDQQAHYLIVSSSLFNETQDNKAVNFENLRWMNQH